MTTRRLIIWIAFLAVFTMAARISVDNDTWWHLGAGQWMVEHRSILQVDPFSYTRGGEAWQYPGWLAEVPMYLIYKAYGPGGLNLWTAFMVTLAFVFVWQTLSGGPFLRAFVIILAAAVSGVYWAARPYLVTFVISAVFLWVLEDYRWGRAKRLWLLPVLMILWANSHGGFITGFLLWGAYTAGLLGARVWRKIQSAGGGESPSLRPLLITGLVMVLAVSLNPSGPVMLAYPFKTVSIGALQDYIAEWQPPDFHSLQVQPFAWLLLLTFGAVGASRRRLSLVDFLLIAGFAYMGFLAGRNIALFALAAPMVLTRHAAPALDALARTVGFHPSPPRPVRRSQSILNLVLLAVVALAVLAKASLVLPRAVNEKHFAEAFPASAVASIRAASPPGRLFNSYNWGGYLLWALPEYPVFIDGRTDLYNDEIISQWLQVVRAEPGWQDVLDRWDVRLVLLEPEMKVIDALRGEGWQTLYQDKSAVVLFK